MSSFQSRIRTSIRFDMVRAHKSKILRTHLLRVLYFEVHVQGASLRGRHTPPATLTQEGKIVWSGQREGLCLICKCKLATWKCQEPRRHAPGKQPRRHTHEYTAYMYVPGMQLHLRCKYMSVSKLVTAELLSLGWRIGTYTGCAGLVLAGCRWVEKTVLNTASTSVQHVVEVTAKRRLF